MKLNLIGTGGVSPIPKPGCNCNLCIKNRENLLSNYQIGPSMFVYDDNLLFDTPEEIRFGLNREKIEKVENIILTHWHPDHTQGIRIIEQLNYDEILNKPGGKPIKIYISEEQLKMFKKFGAGNMLSFYESRKTCKVIYFEHNVPIKFENNIVIPYYIEKTKGYYFLIEDIKTGKKVIYAPCEYCDLKVYDSIKDIDILIAHFLYFENKNIGSGVNYSNSEDSFEKMLNDSKLMNAKKIIITHIEEAFRLGIEELNEAVKEHYKEYDIEFAKDGFKINL